MKITNKMNLPAPLVDAVTREYTYKDKRYSVTQILNGTCEAILKRRHHNEIEQDVSEMIWLIFGTAVHSVLENAQETAEQLKENKLSIKIGDYELSGIFDLYDAKQKKVTDYKTASVWKVIHNDWEDYRKQTLIYAHMLRSIGFECDEGEIIAILKDHSKTKAKVDSSYPQLPVHNENFKFEDKDFEEIKSYLIDKFDDIKEQEQLPDDELRPCSPEERWATETKYAVMKEGRKSAVRVFDDKEQAEILCAELGTKHYVEVREGEDKKCNDYCVCKAFCPYWKEKNNVN